MSAFDRDVVAARTAAIERHLRRVAARLPATATDLRPETDTSDAVVLHLWQAVQLTLDLAFAACLHRSLPTPATYGDAFRSLANDGVLDAALAERLVAAAGFRNVISHAYEGLDMAVVHAAAVSGPRDLRDFLRAVALLVPPAG